MISVFAMCRKLFPLLPSDNGTEQRYYIVVFSVNTLYSPLRIYGRFEEHTASTFRVLSLY